MKKKPLVIYKHYYEPVFKTAVSILIDAGEDHARKKIESIIGEDLETFNFKSMAKTIEYISAEGGQQIIVWLRHPDQSLLSHELIHVIEYCFEVRKIDFSIKNSEVIAYYMEHLTNVFSPFLTKHSSGH